MSAFGKLSVGEATELVNNKKKAQEEFNSTGVWNQDLKKRNDELRSKGGITEDMNLDNAISSLKSNFNLVPAREYVKGNIRAQTGDNNDYMKWNDKAQSISVAGQEYGQPAFRDVDGTAYIEKKNAQNIIGNTLSTLGYQKPSYDNKYSKQTEDKAKQIENSINAIKNFKYDPNTDFATQVALNTARREGDRAYGQALESSSSMTGGLPSSVSASIAGQGRDAQLQKFTDNLPAFEQQARAKMQSDLSNDISMNNVLQSLDNNEYQKYVNAMNFNQGKQVDNRNFEEGVKQADRSYTTQIAQWDKTFEENKRQFGVQTALEQTKMAMDDTYRNKALEVEKQYKDRAISLQEKELALKQIAMEQDNALAWYKAKQGGGSGGGNGNDGGTLTAGDVVNSIVNPNTINSGKVHPGYTIRKRLEDGKGTILKALEGVGMKPKEALDYYYNIHQDNEDVLRKVEGR